MNRSGWDLIRGGQPQVAGTRSSEVPNAFGSGKPIERDTCAGTTDIAVANVPFTAFRPPNVYVDKATTSTIILKLESSVNSNGSVSCRHCLQRRGAAHTCDSKLRELDASRENLPLLDTS